MYLQKNTARVYGRKEAKTEKIKDIQEWRELGTSKVTGLAKNRQWESVLVNFAICS